MGHSLNKDTGCHGAPAMSPLTPFCGTLPSRVSSLHAGRTQAGRRCYRPSSGPWQEEKSWTFFWNEELSSITSLCSHKGLISAPLVIFMNPMQTCLNDHTRSPLITASKSLRGLDKAQTTAALSSLTSRPCSWLQKSRSHKYSGTLSTQVIQERGTGMSSIHTLHLIPTTYYPQV